MCITLKIFKLNEIFYIIKDMHHLIYKIVYILQPEYILLAKQPQSNQESLCKVFQNILID